MADVANTAAGLSSQRMACTGDCAFNFGPCCIDGRCQMGGQCPGPGVLIEGDAATDSSLDARSIDSGVGDAAPDSCPPSGCTEMCPSSNTHNVSALVDGCLVWQCCVDYGADAADSGADAIAADTGSGDAADAGDE
jgi:hypothetical protein